MPWRFLLLLLLACSLRAERPFLQPGAVEPRVVCAKDPRFSYALYLPPGYTPERAWPLLLAFAPDADGLLPVELFRAEAERLGWIVAGSLDSRNGALEPALEAQRAMWDDLHARFRIDGSRVAATGFSGGARMALRLALDRPGKVFGVIASGAFHAAGKDLPAGTRLAVFLACGEEDFNYFELLQARRDLERRGLEVWWETHAGGHRWPPPDVAARGLGALAIHAGRARRAPADPALEARWAEGCLAAARARLPAGRPLQARRTLEALAKFLPEQPAAVLARDEARALGRDPACAAESTAEADAEGDARRAASARGSAAYPVLLKAFAREASKARGLEARYRAMVLRNEAFTTEDLAREAWRQGSYKQSARLFEALAEVLPDRPRPAYFAACAWAQAGEAEQGMAWLRRALDRGFKEAAALREDPALDPLRGRADFRDLLRDP